MSGSLSFITANPAIRSYDRTTDALDKEREAEERQRKRDEARGVDAAVRGGLAEITATPPQPPPRMPSPQPAARPLVSMGDRDSFKARVQAVEDPTGRAVNKGGFSGKYQMGTAAMHAAGLYEPAAGEDLKTNQWRGVIRLPDGRTMNRDQWLADSTAQDVSFDAHQKNLDREIAARGLDRLVGQNIAGRPITREDLYAAMHFAGPTGAESYLRSGGRDNRADSNGTTVSAYMGRVNGPSGMPASGAPVASAPGGVDYSPVTRRLAATPGGGAVGLQVLGQQNAQMNRDQTRGDRLNEQGMARQDRYQQLAMQAFARGDMEVGHYYAKAGGIDLPPEVMQNAGVMKKLGDATTMAARLYGTDRAGAARFVQSFLQSGDAVEAINQAGPPARQGSANLVPRWVQGPDGKSIGVIISPDGVATPITDGSGEPVIKPPTAAGQGRALAIQVKEKMLIAAGFAPQDAAAMAAGATPSGNALAGIAQKISSDVEGDFRLSQMTPEQKAQEKRRRLAEVRDLISVPTAAPLGPAAGLGAIQAPSLAPSAPPMQPAAPPPVQPPAGFVPGQDQPPQRQAPQRPPSVPPGSDFSPSRNMWRDRTGRMYDQNGNPV